LPKSKMLWYRNLFIPNPEHRLHWQASPMLAPEDLLAKHPPTFIGTADVDILRDEGAAYARKLVEHGVQCTYKCYKGMAHPVIQQAKAVSGGAQWQADTVEAIRKALHE
ncbi:hypothetical protein EMMF5_006577, partial [Cystobasidiomycetes sp. EMM_F5]